MGFKVIWSHMTWLILVLPRKRARLFYHMKKRIFIQHIDSRDFLMVPGFLDHLLF